MGQNSSVNVQTRLQPRNLGSIHNRSKECFCFHTAQSDLVAKHSLFIALSMGVKQTEHEADCSPYLVVWLSTYTAVPPLLHIYVCSAI
jgi:hypothetical protein